MEDTKRLYRLVHIRSRKLEKGANTTYIKFTADTVVFKLLQGRELNEMKVLESCKTRAGSGTSYSSILKFYYPRTTLTNY
ncbi:hypothetical protein SFC17_15085 [Bacillus paralicheniformis]|nr:hypothetical protein [Bacillus paralicheniformis]MDE1391241.1 hypothetical protein [Bacillus paralicheniformis]MDR9800151.1 hypothetical protein [Bacillus paralicheniformis]